jgi:rhamnogalacturonan endolyase
MLYYGTNTMISQGDAFGFNDIVDFNTADAVGIEDHKDQASVVVYPNPFRDQSSIVITLEQPASVSLKVFSVTGQLVVNSDEGLIETGQHSILLDATSWKQGLYLYQVTAGDQIFTGKLTVK